MKLSFLLKWMAALESGDYRQTTGALRRTDDEGYSYCCLGVACDVSGLGMWEQTLLDRSYMVYDAEGHEKAFCSSLGSIPRSLSDELGFWDDDWRGKRFGASGKETLQNALMQMNDDEKRTFAEIAQYLRSHVAQHCEDDVN